MQTGIYEQLITQLVHNKFNEHEYYVGQRSIDSAEAALWISRSLSRLFDMALSALPADENYVRRQIDLANELILWLQERFSSLELSEHLIEQPGKLLTAIFEKQNPIAANLAAYADAITPLTGLSQSELFCGSNVGTSLETELKREIRSSDRICWLVSFIKWTGLRIFMDELEQFVHGGKHLQVITTSYMGATDLKAVEWLTKLPNTEVKLSYNHSQERLHAKSYLFLRDTGFHTGYIGSANLSRSALTNGLEWNLKITSREIPHIIDKCISTFETYWRQPEFERFDGAPAAVEKLDNALKAGRGDVSSGVQWYFDLSPHIHQQEILERLQAERELHGRFRNLVVAATGTGKTLISAFDFQRFYRENPQARLLFIAHREEILQQARASYQAVLKNANFGELWVGEHTPSNFSQLFASVQTLNIHLNQLKLSPDFYDYIVIDEVHHIAANSYRPLLSHFRPKILLGLTATPERFDGADILSDFCGVIAAELRLPEAINRRYLCPFQYFGIDDDTDLSRVRWENGRYSPSELTRVYLHNDRRVQNIIRNLEQLAVDINVIRAFGFCVTKDHAEYMAQKFSLKGIRCAVLTSDNSAERQQLRQQLQHGDINILFVVDIFNEGIDIPEVDTLLFLRPTESLTVFLQQLGRGLRLADGKDCVTVLDFVGNARPEYDFAQKFRALIGRSGTSIKDEIEQQFPHLPLGCRIELQRKSREIILRNISQAIINQSKLLRYLKNYRHHSQLPLTLSNFLRIHPNVSLQDIYKPKFDGYGGWHRLMLQAGETDDRPQDKIGQAYYRAIKLRLLGCSSRSYLAFLRQLANDDFRLREPADPIEQQMALMCHYDFWQRSGGALGFSSVGESLVALCEPSLQAELIQVLDLVLAENDTQEKPLSGRFPCALQRHARYSREQILVALGASTFEKQSSSREGVLEIKNLGVELLFVTLQKNEKRFSPTTLYHDYAMSQQLFHWQSQNSARPDRGKGLSYIKQKSNGKEVMLWVRESSKDEYENTRGFVNFGWVDFESSTGAQPMNITWRLREPMPSYLWHDAAKLANG